MSAHLSPIISEFETEEHAASHDRWCRTKVQEAMNNAKSKLAHDEAMSKVRAELEKRKKARADRPLV